jgi:uncharacterized protein (TIGR03790 family)
MKNLTRIAVWVMVMMAGRIAVAVADDSPTAPTRESAATLVIYNNGDPVSVRLAVYYAKRRGIPPERVVGLDCPTNEEITREQYDTTIADPLRKLFDERGWWHAPAEGGSVTDNEIRFVALIRGIPLKIAGTQNYPGDIPELQPALNDTRAAVDSELAILGARTRRLSGPLKNFYYQSYKPFIDANIPPIMLVCRLDGPTEEVVKSMIDGAIEAERDGLNGFAYIDLRGITSGPMAVGDQWLATAAVTVRKYGMPLVWDNAPDVFPTDFPMDHVALYLGWYTQDATGPMARDDFRFVPGAIAAHIHSFSASTLRDAHANWAGPLLWHGAAATLGNVYEPYLALTTNLDIFADRLTNGFTFAESAYAAQPALSWMATFVGDPLYRPFKVVEDATSGTGRPAIEYAAYQAGARTWYQKGEAAGEKQLAGSAKELDSGIVWEGLGLLQWSMLKYDAALGSFQQAEKAYGITEDALRTVLHQVEILRSQGKTVQARGLAGKALARYKGFHGTELLRAAIGLPLPEGVK